MAIPTQNQCFQMLRDRAMPEHIVAHSLQVCRVARLLAGALIEQGLPLDMDLAVASSLLHDITKPRSFETGENHSETGAAFLSKRGYERVGRIVGQHVWLDAYGPEDEPTEAGIVNYADKRVLHDRVVSLDQRMAYMLERYGKTPDQGRRLQWLWRVSEKLERRIYRDLPFSPVELEIQIGDVEVSLEMQDYRAVATVSQGRLKSDK